jgi:predicted RNase H-like HicB family nuclease
MSNEEQIFQAMPQELRREIQDILERRDEVAERAVKHITAQHIRSPEFTQKIHEAVLKYFTDTWIEGYVENLMEDGEADEILNQLTKPALKRVLHSDKVRKAVQEAMDEHVEELITDGELTDTDIVFDGDFQDNLREVIQGLVQGAMNEPRKLRGLGKRIILSRLEEIIEEDDFEDFEELNDNIRDMAKAMMKQTLATMGVDIQKKINENQSW